MKKLVLVVDARMIDKSGIGVYLKSILPEVILQYDVILLGNIAELQQFTWAKNCRIIRFNSPIYSIREQIDFMVKIPKSDILWCPHFNAPILPMKSKKMVTTIHDVNHLVNKKEFGILKYLVSWILYKNAAVRSKEIITVSKFSKKEIKKHLSLSNKKINVVYNGITNTFLKKKNSDIALPEKYILFVGNLKPHKNLITLLKAYNILDKQYKSNFKIVVVGKREGFITSDNVSLKFIKDHNLDQQVVFTGYVDDNHMSKIYQEASLFVFPSLYEGFGLPILEAMISGIPVLGSKLATTQEIGEDAVCYFDTNSCEDLRDKMEAMLKNQEMREAYIQKGKERVLNFSWEESAKKHIRIFNRIHNAK